MVVIYNLDCQRFKMLLVECENALPNVNNFFCKYELLVALSHFIINYDCVKQVLFIIHVVLLLFSCAVRELDVPGDIYETKRYPFEFSSVEMPYESYNGVNVRLR